MTNNNGCCNNARDFTNLVFMVRDVLNHRLYNCPTFDSVEYRRYDETSAELIAWDKDGNGHGVMLSPFFTMPAIMHNVNKVVCQF